LLQNPGHPYTRGRRRLAGIGATMACLAAVAVGSAAEREHGPHEHGVSHLNVAVEEKAVEMELMSPGVDIVGFEHLAESETDKSAITTAVAALKDGAALFAFPAEARCRLEQAGVETGQLEADHDEHHEHEAHGHDAKETEHEHEHEAHAEFDAHYRFVCDRPDRLTHIDVKLFERFPGARKIEVQAISPRGQTAQELTPSSARVEF